MSNLFKPIYSTKVISLILFGLFIAGTPALYASDSELEKMQQVLDKRPNQIGVRQKLGDEYFKRKDYKKVIEVLAPYSNEIAEESLIALAESYEKTNDQINRIRMLQGYVEREPDRFRSNYLLGEALKDAKKYNDAATYLRRSMELAPKHKPSYDALLEIFILEKNNYEARALAQDMIKAFGARPEFDNLMCRLLANDGFLDQAQTACQGAIRSNPKHPDNHIYLAQVFYDQKNRQAAERVFKNSARQFQKSEFVQYAAGQFYFNEKNFPASVRYLETAVKLKDDSFRSHLVLAMALYETRNYKKALVHYNKSCKLDRTKEALTEFRTAAAKLRQSGLAPISMEYDSAIALCSSP